MKTPVALLLSLGAPLAAGALGAIASRNAPVFYAALDKPSWAPPPGVFGPVWTTLYVLMGVAAFLVWREKRSFASRELTGFLGHLAVNALWSWLFFGWRLGAGSVIGVIVLWLAVTWLSIAFFRVSRPAGLLLVPYLAWVTFASALNVAIVQRNPQLFT